MNIIERLLAVIAPHECLQCLKEGSLLCYDCQLQLPPHVANCYKCGRTDTGGRVCKGCKQRSSLYALTAVTPYQDVAKDLVRTIKYERRQAGTTTVARVIARRLEPAALQECIVTHIPTVPKRVRVRGYDQAALIAQEVAKQLQLPYYQLLYRTGTARQVGQTRTVRTTQMTGVFRPANAAGIQNKHILLIDDVITTGATLESAAEVLRKAGAKRVSAAVFAAA